MALKIPPCAICGASPTEMTLKDNTTWVCTSHLPPPPKCRHDMDICEDCAVEQAILFEREACAKLAEEYIGPQQDEPKEFKGQPWKAIAYRIRRRR